MSVVATALGLAGRGELAGAARVLRGLGPGAEPLAALYEALAAYVEDRPGAPEGWRRALDDVAGRHAAKLLFTTFTGAAGGPAVAVGAAATAAFATEGDGQVSVTSRYLFLATVGAQRAVLALREPVPEAEDLVVHLPVRFTSNVGSNFAVILRGDDGDETLRFANHGVTLGGIYHACDPGTPVLFSLALGERRAELYVNGCLRIRTRRDRRPAPRQLRLELVGDEAADLGALVLGVEVWRMPGPGLSFVDGGPDLLAAVVDDHVRRADAHALAETLAAVDDLPVPGLAEHLEERLDGLVGRTPYRQEVVDALLLRAGVARAEAWRAAHRHRLPRPILAVRDLTVRFSAAPHRLLSLGRLLLRRDPQYFDVLRDVDFAVYPGDVLGIIGANGAGKSTLLRTVSGLVPIARGEVFVGGRHMLLRAGVGFRDEATGRENIRLAACYLQVSPREIDARLDGIIEFAELGEAIDRPLKYYSDGMRARLVFALATSVSPDVLLLDELLGAGDVKFRDKAARRMDELIARARAVVVVTHALDFVRTHCTKALYLARGRQRYFGHPGTAVSRYLDDLHLAEAAGGP